MKKKENKIKVLFNWDVDHPLKQYLVDHLNEITNLELIFLENPSEKELLKEAPQIDILVGWRPTKEFLIEAKELRLLINPGAGVQHLIPLFNDLQTKNNIKIVNGHGNSYFTAQHAVSLLMTLCNKVIPHHLWMKEGKWRTGDKEAKSIPLRYRKVGLLGYGAVNQKVHRFLMGFDVKFAVLKRTWEKNIPFQIPTPIKKFTPDTLKLFMEYIDTIIIAIPLTEETKNLLTYDLLKLLGKNGIIINMARGDIIKEKDLYDLLKNGEILGAGLDVWYEYNPDSDDNGRKYPYHFPFHNLENVILSPHRGASPFDDLERWNEVVENISRFCKGETSFLNEVNLNLGY